MGTVTRSRSANIPVTITLDSLATSADLTVGVQSDDFIIGANCFDVTVSGVIVGNSVAPTDVMSIEVWLIPQRTDGYWPDTFTDTNGARTVSSRNELWAYGKLIKSIPTNAAVSHSYSFEERLTNCLGSAALPSSCVIFVTHKMGQALAATGSSIGYVEHTAGY